ncbi:hypothetical protein EXT46_05295 [Pseudoalteromonas sp. CO325X]|uniref:hypothetical protein n=1 Tax=Pseudoalteromonas sp. CO325X TaxID=1777262 RepID=UPI001022EF3D|nr:hypothetical protein [Pseudoalteromonas sp. CO325X]RZF83709.1 hypothetical protein EXT46_05295 [Pseudoalteromonas sp. CO325X]
MALYLSTNIASDERRSWQTIKFSYPAETGFKKGEFKAQFIVPDSDALKDEMEEKTIREVLDTYFVDAKDIRATPGDQDDIDFSDEVKEQILKTTYLQTALWEQFMRTVQGGAKAKN